MIVSKMYHLNPKRVAQTNIRIMHVHCIGLFWIILLCNLDESCDDKVNERDAENEPGDKSRDITPTAGIKVCRKSAWCAYY